MADSHETVFGAGLAALAAALDIPQVLINNKDETDEESCWDFLALTRTGCNRIYALCHETTSAFKFQVRGLQRPPLSSSGGSGHDQDQEPDENSLEYVVNKMKQDGIEALAHTGIIEQLYLSFSRKQQKVGPAATSSSTYGHAAAGGGSADETMKSRYTLLIEILIRLARHSRSFSTLIVQQEGFLDIIVRGCLQISQWPSPEHQQPLPMAIKLLRLLAQSSIKNATAILDAQYLQICGRFLCCTHAELSDHVVVCNTLDLQAEIYLLLNTLFTYKLGAWFADEYRALFLNQIKSFGLVGYPATSPSSTSSFQSLEFYKSKALANLNRMMATMTRLFGQSLHVGSSDDCVRPLIEASLSVATVLAKKDSINKTGTSSNNERQFFTQMAAFTAHCDFVSEYLWQLRASAKGKDGTDNSSNTVAISFAEYLRRATDFGNTWSSSASPLKTAMTALKAMFKEATPSSSSSTYTSSSSFLSLHPTLEPTGMGLRRQNRVSAAARMAFLSMACDVIAARLDIITRCALIHPMAWKGVHEANVIEGGSGWDNNIRQLLFDGIKAGAWGWMYGCLRSDWIRVFTSGWNGLQRAWVEGCGGYMPLPNSTNIRGNSGVGGNLMRLDVTRMRQLVPDIVAVAANLFTDLLPGDEYIASRILHTCLTGESWRRVALGMVEEEGVNTATNSNNSIIVSKRQAAWQFLREYYDSNLWDDASLCMSERLYLVSDAQAKLEEKDGDDEMNELSRENELSLMLDMSSSSGGGSHICLPVPTSWMYSPLEILVDHRNLESTAAANASSVSEEEDEDEGVDRDAIDGGGSSRDEDLCDVDLVSEMLIFTERLSQCGSNSSAASDDGRKWWFLLRHPRELQQQQQSATSELNEFKMASVAGRLYHLLGVYLLLPEASSRENVSRRRRQQQQLSSQEVFSDARISSFMDKYLRENVLSLVEQGVCCVLSSTTSSPNDQLLLQQPHLLFPLLATLMERTAGGQMKLYTAYRQLVSRYQGVSFGNPVFGKLLLLPFIFPAGFASDYRSHFLGEMMDMLRPFDDDVLFGNGGGEEMLSLQKWISLQRIETDKEVQSLYVKVLSGSRSRSHRQGIVGRVALHQVSGFVFDGYSEFEKGSESSGTWSATTKLSAATPSSTPTVSASDGDGDDDAVVVGLKRRMVDALAGNKEIWNAVVGLRDCTRVAEFIKIKLNLVLKD